MLDVDLISGEHNIPDQYPDIAFDLEVGIRIYVHDCSDNKGYETKSRAARRKFSAKPKIICKRYEDRGRCPKHNKSLDVGVL